MYDVITIGTATRDVFLQSPLFRILRDPRHLKKLGFPSGEAQLLALGGKIEIKKLIFVSGGGATNAGVTFSRQKLKTATLIKIGIDEAAKAVLDELKKENIKGIILVDKKVGTASSTILLAPTGERTILNYRGASEDLEKKEIPLDKLQAKWAYVVPGRISFSIIELMVNHFANRKIEIAINPSKAMLEMGLNKLTNILRKSKVVLLNREEASYLTGVRYNDEKKIFRELDKVVPGIAIMTDGSRGAFVSDGRLMFQAGIFKEKKLIDRTGAGDAFGSGFVAGLIQKKEECEKGKCKIENVKYAIRLASANATSVIERVGAKPGILTKADFEKSTRFKHLKIKITNI